MLLVLRFIKSVKKPLVILSNGLVLYSFVSLYFFASNLEELINEIIGQPFS